MESTILLYKDTVDTQRIDIEIDFNYLSTDHYVYTKCGIYKAVSGKFMKTNMGESNTKTIEYNHQIFYLQESNEKLDKNDVIPSIPFDHFIVKQDMFEYVLNDDISILKTVENDEFQTICFKLNGFKTLQELSQENIISRLKVVNEFLGKL